jgi:hypothetical protein
MNKLITIAVIALLGAGCPGPGPGPVIGGAVVDCVSADRTKIDSLLAEFTPLLTGGSMDWSMVYQRAKQAGTSIGGCFLAELVQSYLGGKMAPATGDGWAARQTLEDFRAKEADGATFKTQYGNL